MPAANLLLCVYAVSIFSLNILLILKASVELLGNILLNLTIEGHCQMPEAVRAHFFLTPYTGRRDLRANVRTVAYTAIRARFWIGSLRVRSEHKTFSWQK